eukprot:1400423-Rhodomonas_salina.1
MSYPLCSYAESTSPLGRYTRVLYLLDGVYEWDVYEIVSVGEVCSEAPTSYNSFGVPQYACSAIIKATSYPPVLRQYKCRLKTCRRSKGSAVSARSDAIYAESDVIYAPSDAVSGCLSTA